MLVITGKNGDHVVLIRNGIVDPGANGSAHAAPFGVCDQNCSGLFGLSCSAVSRAVVYDNNPIAGIPGDFVHDPADFALLVECRDDNQDSLF